jgi:uncharacterized membrane protein YbjE (DUF340 family)
MHSSYGFWAPMMTLRSTVNADTSYSGLLHIHFMEPRRIVVLVLMLILSNGSEVYGQYVMQTDKAWSWHHRFGVAFRNSNWRRVLGSLLIMAAFLYVFDNEELLKRAAVQLLRQRYSQLLVAAIALGLGALAFWFKKKSQVNYGLFEVLFGVASAFRLARGLLVQDAMLAQWASLVAAVYVVSSLHYS